MKQFVISILFVVVLTTIFTQPAFFNAFLALLFLGIVPGTNIQIPFWIMLIVLFGGGFILIRWLGSQPLYIGSLAKQEKTAKQLARKKVAKKVLTSPKSITQTAKKRTKSSTKKRPIRHLA